MPRTTPPSSTRVRPRVELLEARVNPAGQFDPAFGTEGKTFVDFNLGGGQVDEAEALFQMPDGRIVMAGAARTPFGSDDFAVTRQNADGSLDTTFGGTGRVVVPLDQVPNGNDRAMDVVVQPDGRIVVAGYSDSATGRDFAVVRLNANGSLDTTFDGDGKAFVRFALGGLVDFAEARGVDLQADGRIVLGGLATGTQRVMAAARLNTDGSPDTTFSGDGQTTVAVGVSAEANDVVRLVNNQVVLAGSAFGLGSSRDIVVVQLTAAGAPDPSFGGGDGIASFFYTSTTTDELANAVTTLNGTIVVAGAVSGTSPFNGFAVVQFGSAGDVFDSVVIDSFNGVATTNAAAKAVVADPANDRLFVAGTATVPTGNVNMAVATIDANDGLNPFSQPARVFGFDLAGDFRDDATGVALDPAGRVVVGGSTTVPVTGRDFAVARLIPDFNSFVFNFDTAFDGDGLATIPVDLGGEDDDTPADMVRLADGRIVVVGTVTTDNGQDVGVTRLNADGSRDLTFGTNGVRAYDLGIGGTNTDVGRRVTLLPDGRIVVGGQGPFNDRVGVAVLLADGTPDGTFGGGDGITSFAYSNTGSFPTSTLNALTTQANGMILVGGEFYSFEIIEGLLSTSNAAVVRLTASGAFDPGFAGGAPLLFKFDNLSGSRTDALLVRPDGKIWVVGTVLANGFSASDLGIALLNADGTFDPAFGTGGKSVINLGGTFDDIETAILLPDGRIAVVGSRSSNGVQELIVARLTAGGTLDPTFGAGGVFAMPSPFGNEGLRGMDVGLAPDGKLVVVGVDQDSLPNEDVLSRIVVARLTEAGQLDPLFANVGFITFTPNGSLRASQTPAVALRPDLGILFSYSVNQNSAGYQTDYGVGQLVGLDFPPTISDVGDVSISAGRSSGPIGFTVGDLETAPGLLVVTATSSNPAVIPDGNLVLGGTGANRTITVNTLAGTPGTAVITLTVRDAAGNTATDTFVVTVTDLPPTISDVPDQTVSAGRSTGPLAFTVGDVETAPGQLVVTATSSNPAVIPNANLILGGTGANRTITVNTLAGVAGVSTVTITVRDAAGNTTTETFVVTVTDLPPTISDVTDQTIEANTSTGPLSFTVGDSETAVGELVVTATSSDTTLVPASGLVLGGTGANRTVTVTPAAGRTGTVTITLTVRDAAGQTATDTFVVTVREVNTPPTIEPIPDQTIPASGNTGPLDVIINDAETPPGDLIVTVTVSDPNLLPPASIVLGGADGARTLTLTPPEGLSGTVVVTVTVTDEFGRSASTSFTLVIEPLPPPIPPLNVPDRLVVAGPDPLVPGEVPPGIGSAIGVPDLLASGGVRVALGDVNGDGVPDTIAGTGPTVQNVVFVYDGKTGQELFRLSPFEPTFTGGVYVAAGDVNRDGFDDLIIGAGETGGARVRVLSGKDLSVLDDFFAIEDLNFRGGVRVAAGDLNGDRYPDVIAAAGEGGGPRVSGWDGYYLRPDRERRKLFADFFAFEPSVRNGTFVAAGDLDGDGIAELVAGAGPGGGPRVTAFAGRALGREGILTPVANFFAFDPSDRRGVRVAVREFDGDGRADLLTGSGSRPVVVTFSAASALSSGDPDPMSELDVLSGFNGGVFVA